MSQFRTTLTRIGASAVTLAAATALIVPGVAAADEGNAADNGTETSGGSATGSSATGSLDLFAEFLPSDTLKAFKILTSPDFSFDAVSECVGEKFGLDDPGNDVFKIIIDCVIISHEDDDTE